MNNDTVIERAHMLATKFHAGQIDKAGEPYIKHLVHVSNAVESNEAKTIALLHDILEDTECTAEQLKVSGFHDEIIDAVVAMTHLPHESYDEFIRRVSKNRLATMVKIEDMKHNSDLSRLNRISQKDLDRAAKYRHYIDFLSTLNK